VVSSDGSRRYQTTHTLKDDIFRSTAGDTSWRDYSIEAKIKFNDILADGGGGLMARYQDTFLWYGFGYAHASGAWQIGKRSEQGDLSLARGPKFVLEQNHYYAVKIVLKGSSLKLYIDGVLQASATDTTYSKGKIGFAIWHATVLLDDVTVTVP